MLSKTVTVRVFGGFALEGPDDRQIVPKHQKVSALIGYLALSTPHAATRSSLAGLLWSNAPEDRARMSLRQCLRRMRHMFAELGVDGVEVDQNEVRLAMPDLVTDIDRLVGDVRNAIVDDRLVEGLWTPDSILAGFEDVDPAFQHWLTVLRANRREALLKALEKILRDVDLGTGLRDRAATAILAIDPTHEEAHRHQIAMLATVGNTAASLRRYNELWKLLDEEFDVEPARATQELVAAIKLGTFSENNGTRSQSASAAQSEDQGQPESEPLQASLQSDASLPELGQSRLCAILCVDACGSSRDMRRNEAATIRQIAGDIEIFRRIVAECRGSVSNLRGDGMLATFDSASDAIDCAFAIQRRTPTENGSPPMKYRIGVHIGDTYYIHDQVVGDSVNVAARIESHANPGDVLVSRPVFETLRGRTGMHFISVGTPPLKNIGNDLELFRVEPASPAKPAPSLLLETAPVPDLSNPSVAVLPFESVSERLDLAALASGFAEEVIGLLTRFRGLDVIAAGSSIFWLGGQPPTNNAYYLLHARYLVHGRVQLSTRRIRVKVRLTDSQTERTVWTEQYDRVFDDIFDIQTEIAECAVASMAVQIEHAERELARARNPDSLDAYALQLQAREEAYWIEPAARLRAYDLAKRAITVSPNYARAHAVMSRTLSLAWKYGWSDDPEASFEAAHNAAVQAVDMDKNDPRGLAELGFVALYRREHGRSLTALSRALELNPSDADIIAEYADALKHAGRRQEAIELFERAIRLNPLHRDGYQRDLAHTYFVDRQFERAIETINGMIDPTMSLRVLTASYSLLGQMEEARRSAAMLRVRHPQFSARAWAKIVPDKDPADTELLVEGLERAGL